MRSAHLSMREVVRNRGGKADRSVNGIDAVFEEAGDMQCIRQSEPAQLDCDKEVGASTPARLEWVPGKLAQVWNRN